jgi:glycosyltransferase A (GT-A) superfamily protein (DUF2064 family)
MKENILALLAKYPEPDFVKTRLAHALSAERAADLCRLIAEKVFRQTRPQGGEYERVVFYAPSSGKARYEDWLPGERLLPQRGDIGEIMANALGDLLGSGAERAVIAGVDIPGLERRIAGMPSPCSKTRTWWSGRRWTEGIISSA